MQDLRCPVPKGLWGQKVVAVFSVIDGVIARLCAVPDTEFHVGNVEKQMLDGTVGDAEGVVHEQGRHNEEKLNRLRA